MRTAIFLGAGASKADGAPLQNELFHEFFKGILNESADNKIKQELVLFFSNLFEVSALDSDKFPTFEEAIGILDLACLRHESFRGYDLLNLHDASNRIGKIKQYLIIAMAKAISDKIGYKNNTWHDKLVKKLSETSLLDSTVILSSNYDILIDNALSNNNSTIDHGIGFINHENNYDDKIKIPLLKLHGSLNWLYCATCNSIRIEPHMKPIGGLMDDIKPAICGVCKALTFPVIVPPTYYKDMTNIFLATIWNKAERLLCGVNHIIFCGYSMPESDMHIKYLLKRAQINRSEKSRLYFTVCNDHLNKQEYLKVIEKDRFQRFLGDDVKYTKHSFQTLIESLPRLLDPFLIDDDVDLWPET
jgi:hypothetical protein